MLISLFGATAGQGVVWYTGQFYALFYLQTILKVNAHLGELHRRHRAAAGHAVLRRLRRALRPHRPQEDHDGRLSARRVSYIPIYHAMQAAAGSNVVTAISQRNPVTGAISSDAADARRRRAAAGARSAAVHGLRRRSSASPIAWKLDPAGVHPGDLRDDGLRPDRRVSGRGVSRRRSATRRCRCRTTSATASSAACCR